MKNEGTTCISCKFFANGTFYESDLISFDTIDHCRRYPEHVAIADGTDHWCGDYVMDEDLGAGEIAKRIEQSQKSQERRRDY